MNETRSTKAKWAVLVIVVMSVAGFWIALVWKGVKQAGEPIRAMSEMAARTIHDAAKLQMAHELPGEEILKNYALASTRPEDDLHAMAHVFANFRLLVKGDAFRMGANEEFAAALLGKNAAKEVFLTAPHACLNARGQIIDRWGTALFFHVRDRDRVDIRSAGPDREMWTADDLHRLANGDWHRGAGLPE